ncbi:MAG: hypothetical protein PHI94_06865 [Eubacteriaceae bacterium]|nr:hypothetical protein [Eubacteriaceae bacterium]
MPTMKKAAGIRWNPGGEVNAALFNAITREVRRGNGRLTVIAQSDCDDLFQILGQFAGETDLAITHLICLDNSGSLERQRYYNLNSMERCISLFLQHSHYQALYYYDNVAARFDAFSMFPFMVMTAEGVVTFDVQCECGFYHQDADAVAQFFRKAQRLKASALPFFEDIGGLEEEFKVLSQCHFVQYVEAVPFVIPLLNERMLKQALTMDTGLDDTLVQMIHQYLKHARIQSDQQETWIFTEEGLDYFAETGRITAVPDAFYKALPLEDRVTLLRGVLRMVDNERFRMLLPSIGPMNLFFETYIARDAVYFLHCDEGNGELHFYCTREAMLVNLFSQFVSRMEAYGELCTKEQSHGDQPVSGKVECSGNRSF